MHTPSVNPSAEADLQTSIEARRRLAMSMLTDEDTKIIVWRSAGMGIAPSASHMISAERNEHSMIDRVERGRKMGARVVDLVALSVAVEEFNAGRCEAPAVRA